MRYFMTPVSTSNQTLTMPREGRISFNQLPHNAIILIFNKCSFSEMINILNICFDLTEKKFQIIKDVLLSKSKLDAKFLSKFFRFINTIRAPGTLSRPNPYEKLKKHVSMFDIRLNATHLEASKDLSVKDLCALIYNCPALSALDLSDYSMASNNLLIKIANNSRKLTSICLSEQSPPITDRGIRVLAKRCKKLQTLSLPLSQITDKGLRELGRNCKKLQTLNLYGADNITDAGLTEIATECKDLQSINLYGCTSITDRGGVAIAHNCSRLKRLDLSLTQIKDRTLIELANNCRDIRYLKLVACFEITDQGLEPILDNCKSLKFLDLFDCHFISEDLQERAYQATRVPNPVNPG